MAAPMQSLLSIACLLSLTVGATSIEASIDATPVERSVTIIDDRDGLGETERVRASGSRDGEASDASTRRAIPANLLVPLPQTGAVPPIVRDPLAPSMREMALRAQARDYRGQIRRIVRAHLHQRRDELRKPGFEELGHFRDPAALPTLVDELEPEGDEARLWLLDHLSTLGDAGQAGLAYAAISTEDRGFRDAAAQRIERPATSSVLMVIDGGLRDRRHRIVNASGWLAGQIQAIEAIPPMIFGQAVGGTVPQGGDLAWIAVGTTTSYVANVVPVVGGNAGAFQPVIGLIREGSLLRVMDAVVTVDSSGVVGDHRRRDFRAGSGVVVYRLDLHNALVAMTSAEWGRSTDHLQFDLPAWYRWFNEEFVPHMQQRDLIERVAADDGIDW